MAEDVTSGRTGQKSSLLKSLDDRIIDLLPAGVCVCEAPTGTIVRYNRRAAELWGRDLSPEGPHHCLADACKIHDASGTPIPADKLPMVDVLRNGSSVRDWEAVIERPDGSHITVLVNIDAIRNDEDEVIGAVSVFKDITRRQQLESESKRLLTELEGERERLLEIFERSPAFMAVMRGPDHVFERINGHYAQLTGQRDLIGKPLRTALPEVEGQGYIAILDRVYRTGEPFIGRGMPISVRREPGGELEERFVDFVYEPLRDRTGAVSGVLAHGLDLTEHLRAEENLAWVTAESERWRRLYETVLSATPDLVYVFDLNYRFTYANAALLKMWGQTWDDAIGKTCLELGYPPWHAAMHEREIDQVVATRRPVRGEVPFSGTNGERIYDYIFVPVFGADGEVEAVAGTTRDVTERHQMERELQRRASELALSDRKKDEFIALLAHELRNPLAPLRNGLQVMDLAGSDEAAVARVRGMMERQLNHMVRLIDDLLDISRLNENRLELQKTRVLLEEAMKNALEIAQPAIDAAGHRLTLSLPRQPVVLHADLTRLVQIFGNLLSNSTKYMPRGGRIWFAAKCEGNEVVVSVRDSGVGISAEALPQVFEMFSRIDPSPEVATGGLGIGLALVKVLVEMHGGRISAESGGPGRGSTFTVSLPVVQADRDGALGGCDEHGRKRQSRRRILVVDDNDDSCSSMAMMLDMLGHEVHTAHDGLEAVTAARRFLPELILMDVGMPNLNGYEATRLMRRESWSSGMRIVALTGWGQEEDRSMSRAAGCDSHLVKPVNLSELEELLSELNSGATGVADRSPPD